MEPNKSSFSDIKEVVLEPNSDYTFYYGDFELKIKTNTFTAISFSTRFPQFTFHPIEKSSYVWTRTN